VSTDVPTFAVVGRVNKGKSSIVSTFVEDESVEVDRTPGTTRECRTFDLRIGNRVLCRLVDTPGFEDAPRALAWMRERERTAADRPRIVEEFVRTFRGGDEFREECKLLAPILDGAGILYVVDASRPYRANYEAEMEILQWTGRPRMALLNTISNDDHAAEWRRALDQYFSLVKVFDAHDSTFADRIALLRAFRELRDDRREALDAAIAELEADWERRRRRAATHVADLLVDALRFTLEWPLAEGESPEARREEWLEKFHEALRRRERDERTAIETLYRHERLLREEREIDPAYDRDLFAERSWRVLGLDTWQLVRAGVVGGAALGGVLDVSVGGTSFLAGSIVGGLVGGLSSYLGARSAADLEVLGRKLGGPVARIGPLRNPNFPWLLLDRALLHYRGIVRRAHARRDALVLRGADAREGIVAHLDSGRQARLTRIFTRISRPGVDALGGDAREELVDELVELMAPLEREPATGAASAPG
jgi:hypothetical protein